MATNHSASPEEQPQPKKPASRSGPGVALRIILVLVVGAIIGGVVYFTAVGWIPYLDQRVFQPIEENQALLQQIGATQQVLADQVSGLTGALEGSLSAQDQEIQSTLESLREELSRLDELAAALQSGVETNTYYSITLIPSFLATASAQREATDRNVSALATAQMADRGSSRDIAILVVMELLSRANQFLLHNNYGLAEDELSLARDRLSTLASGLPGDQAAPIEDILTQVEGALASLPAQPILAAGKLELAWQLALGALSGSSTSATVTPTPYPPAQPAGTVTPTPN